MEKLKEKNRLIFLINLSRLVLLLGVIVFLQVFNYLDVDITGNVNNFEQAYNASQEKLRMLLTKDFNFNDKNNVDKVKEILSNFIEMNQLTTAPDASLNKDKNALTIVGIVSLIYSLILLFAPFDKIKNKFLGYLFCLIDSFLIFYLILLTGEISSPFIILLFFPLVSLSILYETVGSTFAIFLFTLYTVFLLIFKGSYSSRQIADICVKMGILSLFSLYIGNIGKEIKSKNKLEKLENEIDELKSQLEKSK